LEQLSFHELPQPLFFDPYFTFFFFLIFSLYYCLKVHEMRACCELCVAVITPLKVGQFISNQGLGCALVPFMMCMGSHSMALGTRVMAIMIRGRVHAWIFPTCYYYCPDHLLYFMIFIFFLLVGMI